MAEILTPTDHDDALLALACHGGDEAHAARRVIAAHDTALRAALAAAEERIKELEAAPTCADLAEAVEALSAECAVLRTFYENSTHFRGFWDASDSWDALMAVEEFYAARAALRPRASDVPAGKAEEVGNGED